MSLSILATKLYSPPPRPKIVPRLRLIKRLNNGHHRKLTLVSAPAGFGKTTLVSEWIIGCEQPAAWLSVDEGDRDPIRFLTYFIAALQVIAPTIGEGVLAILQSPQPPPNESILTALLNEIASIPDSFLVVIDDYHIIDAKAVDKTLAFLLKHMPPQMHLVIITREDPSLPLARYRARNQLTELRAADLRFTPTEAAEFLNEVMHLNLSIEAITALETRTEGWIAGLQLAALALQGTFASQGEKDTSRFIKSFTGSHRFVLDYLAEEVLQQQSKSVQTFLLRTSILDRLCGSLCDAVMLDLTASGQETLAYLERVNLFLIPLDNERRWYRYHHLFADLLRQRLHQSNASDTENDVATLHSRASKWYEKNNLEIEAFHHAAAANDIEHAARLVEGEGMPLLFRGAVAPVLNWLASLPTTVLDTRPALWVIYASALLFVGQLSGVEQKLQAAEAALYGVELNDKTRDLIGHIASIRATLAVGQFQADRIIAQSHRALAYLHPDNLPVRTATTWTLGFAYQLQGDRVAARRAYTEAQSISQAIGHFIINIMATIGLGNLQEADNQLHAAAQTYQHVLKLVGDPPLSVACEAHLGLARVLYQWNDLDAAHWHGKQSVQLARQIENSDRFIASELFLARLKFAQGDTAETAVILNKASQYVREHNFVFQIPEVAADLVLLLLHQGNLVEAAHQAQMYQLPISQARVYLAQGDISAALAALMRVRKQVEAKGWADIQLEVMVLQAVAHQMHGESDKAVHLLGEALTLAEPGGFIRIFVDEGLPLAELLTRIKDRSDRAKKYIHTVLAAFGAEKGLQSAAINRHSLAEPLSLREFEVLQLIAHGLSNREISEQLFLALSTVKGHNRIIFEKLQVKRRTEAVARARELGLLSGLRQ
jgi:LuxR family transcriptional regulator, maltose regulon positive regulatory protein